MPNPKKNALNTIQNLSSQLTSHGIKTSEIDEKQYNFELFVEESKEKVKVLVYFGKKGVSTILQGDIYSATYKKVKSIVLGSDLFESINDEIEEPSVYIGTDESGKGDFFGPLVIAALLVDDRIKLELKEIGTKDSKLLDDNQIMLIAREIKKIVPEDYRNIVIIKPEKYNQLYQSFKNLNKLLAWGHAKSIENILLKKSVSTVISDKFGSENLILDQLGEKKINVKLIQSTKAERFTAVAAASILARNRMINWFSMTSEKLNMKIPKGAGDVVNITAKKISNKNGPQVLSKLVKLHFKNYEKIF